VFLLTDGTYTENEPNDIATISKVYRAGRTMRCRLPRLLV
jgi:hypothetical protein